jgi:hypothetical protein
MEHTSIFTDVFAANAVFAVFLWGFVQISRIKDETKIPAHVYAAVLVPLAIFLLCLTASGVTPPFLAAVSAR